jgi:DNA-binding ferritin-like protein
MSTLGRATTAVRGVSRTRRQADDVDRAEENVAAVTQRLADLEAEFKAEVETIERSFDPQTEQLGTVSLKPTKANINVKLLTLVWVPYRQDAGAQAKPAWE